MYFPIPEGAQDSQTVSVTKHALPCSSWTGTWSTTAAFNIPKSATPLMKKNDFVLEEVIRPTGGKWSEIKASGSIKMTEMSIKKESIRYDIGQVTIPLIKHSLVAVGDSRVKPTCVQCSGITVYNIKAAIVRGSYIEQGDLDYWKTKYPDAPHYNSGVSVLDTGKLEAAKSEVFAELYQTYNLGEEVAELKETVLGVTKLLKEGISLILRSRQTINGLLKKGYVNEASSRWMEFRYGIMPILYSIQDILALKQEGCYATVRKKVYADVEVEPEYGSEDLYFETIGTSSLTASITAKARWGSQDLKIFDRININPLTTFTAVLPYAMIVRWFFNVQSYLDARVKSLTSLALEQRACVAIREKRELGTYLSIKAGYQNYHIKWDGDDAVCGNGFYGTHDFGTYTDYRPQRVRLSWDSANNYTRYLFNPSDVQLVFNPYISWKRAIDSLIMVSGPMSKLMRALK